MKQLKGNIVNLYQSYTGYLFPLILAIFVLLGNSYHQVGSWDLCFGSFPKFLLSLLLLCILTISLKFFLGIGFRILDFFSSFKAEKYGILSKHVLPKTMILLILCWMPYLLAAYPGALCIDSQTQLNQVYGYSPFSLHHPMFHTLLMGFFIKGGQSLLGSANLGLFLYIAFQTTILAFALSFSIWAMCYKRVPRLWVYLTLGFYCITPLFGYYASMAIKDTLFNATFLIFMVCFILLWEDAPLRFLPFLLAGSAVCVCQFRNNGIYLIGFTFLFCLILTLKKKCLKEHAKKLLLPILSALILHFALNAAIAAIFQPLEGYSREMLSIFMQQTARFVSEYEQDITPEETAVLQNIFGSLEELKNSYNPHLSDPVKNLFKMDANSSDLLSYLKVWFSQFWRHPDAYFEAFFHGAYGWFYPFVDNAGKYYDPGFIFTKPAFASSIDKAVSWWYEAFRRIPVLNLLQSIGMFTWMMFFSISYLWKKNKRQYLLYFGPILLSLLICIAAPAFFQHARYGFPILFCMPFLIGRIIAPTTKSID